MRLSAESHDWRRQDDGDRDAHCVADRQCRPAFIASKSFTKGFLDRAHPVSRSRIGCAYCSRTILTTTIPIAKSCRSDMLDDVNGAKIVITNYHAFKLL